MKERTGTYAIISTHIAGTEGVSLEIEKWANVIEHNHVECYYIAGEFDRQDIIIPENALTIPMAFPLGVALFWGTLHMIALFAAVITVFLFPFPYKNKFLTVLKTKSPPNFVRKAFSSSGGR